MSSANRGLTSGRSGRKRSREPEDDNAGFGASSPAGDIRSSPPAYPIQHGGDDDDDVEEDVELALDIDDADEMAEDEDGIDLFANNFERDYKPREDDQYDDRDIDDEGDYDDLDVAERRRLEDRAVSQGRWGTGQACRHRRGNRIWRGIRDRRSHGGLSPERTAVRRPRPLGRNHRRRGRVGGRRDWRADANAQERHDLCG